MNRANFVFGYGSLVNVRNLERYLGRKLIPDLDFAICGLNNYRRCWNVAMDNNLDLPGYKYYRVAKHSPYRGKYGALRQRPASQDFEPLGSVLATLWAESPVRYGSRYPLGQAYRLTKNRPDCFVTFLNIGHAENETISGILFRVSDVELENLDRRERNYHRVDVTNKINIDIKGTVWTYLGLQSAEKRYQTGLQRRNAIISRDYFDLVNYAYLSLGDRYLNHYIATTDEPNIPIVALTRHQID